jgi:hypothetical protein
MVMLREWTRRDYQKLWLTGNLKEGEKRGRPRRTWRDGIYTAMNERDLRMGEWNNRRQWKMEVGRRRQTFKTAQYICICIYTYVLNIFLMFSCYVSHVQGFAIQSLYTFLTFRNRSIFLFLINPLWFNAAGNIRRRLKIINFPVWNHNFFSHFLLSSYSQQHSVLHYLHSALF